MRRLGGLVVALASLPIARQLASFSGVGVVAMVGHYATLIAAVELAHAEPVVAALMGFLVGGVISYLLNRRWTFRSDRPHDAAVPRFAAVALTGFVLTGLSMSVLADGLGLHYLVAQIVTTGTVMIWNFTANRLWTFRPQPS